MRALVLPTILLLHAAGSTGELSAQPIAAPAASKAPPTMRQDIYRELRAGRQCIENGDFACGESALAGVLARPDLKSYERAQAWNFAARLALARSDAPKAIDAYGRMLAERDAPLGLVRSAHYALAQLYAATERLDEAQASLDRWWSIATPSAPDPFALRAEIEYRRGQFEPALAAIDRAVAMAEARGTEPLEAWLQVRAAALDALGDLSGAAEQLEAMLRRWPTRQYHLQLAGVYSKLGNDARKHELYETAYKSGWLVDGVDLLRLASFRIEAGRLEDALNVLEQNRDRGILPDGDSLGILIARIRDWVDGEALDDLELQTLLRNARREQQVADEPRRLRL